MCVKLECQDHLIEVCPEHYDGEQNYIFIILYFLSNYLSFKNKFLLFITLIQVNKIKYSFNMQFYLIFLYKFDGTEYYHK